MPTATDLQQYTFGDDGRIYTDHDDLWLPSVSTVLDVRENPPGLKNYLKNTPQAEQDEKTFYTQNRGTLIHYHLLSQLVEEEFWSDDEEHSKQCLQGSRVHEGTGLTGGQDTWDRFQRDLEWAEETWELIRRIHGIHPETTFAVELFVQHTDVGYAGQFDLLYSDGGDIVLADIKTSKYVYDKHLLQAVAYAHAVDVTVDRMEIVRMNPDGETWEVSSSHEWVEDVDGLWDEFCALRDQLASESIQDLKSKVQDD